MTRVDYSINRKNMVESQIKTNGVTDDRILKTLSIVPRERFVPHDLERLAYIDDNIEITSKRFLINPMVFAKLIQSAHIENTDICLDVGCGSGYSSVILGQIAGTVFALESDLSLAKLAEENFEALGANNILLKNADFSVGFQELGPFDVIVINGAVEYIPELLLEQLNSGGRLVAVVRQEGIGSRAKIFQKLHRGITERDLFDATVPLLSNWFVRPKSFKFQ